MSSVKAPYVMRDFVVENTKTNEKTPQTAVNAMSCLAVLEKEARLSRCILDCGEIKAERKNETPYMIHQISENEIVKSWRVLKGLGYDVICG